MTTARTQSELIAQLDHEFAWREKEIITFNQEIRKAKRPWQTTLIRAAVPLLYAHWEGFIKNSTESVISFVGMRRLKYCQLARHYWAIGLRGKLSNLGEVPPPERIEIVEFILNMGNRVTRFKARDHVKTDSNLSSTVFVRIASTIGIDTSPYEVRFPLIDESLLKRRNHIAHGQQLTIDAAAYNSLQQEIRTLLRQYHTDLQNYVVQNAYRSPIQATN